MISLCKPLFFNSVSEEELKIDYDTISDLVEQLDRGGEVYNDALNQLDDLDSPSEYEEHLPSRFYTYKHQINYDRLYKKDASSMANYIYQRIMDNIVHATEFCPKHFGPGLSCESVVVLKDPIPKYIFPGYFGLTDIIMLKNLTETSLKLKCSFQRLMILTDFRDTITWMESINEKNVSNREEGLGDYYSPDYDEETKSSNRSIVKYRLFEQTVKLEKNIAKEMVKSISSKL